ncbi:MAG: hypothetical protein BWX79_00300 [Alphaproteobacteria bacterium ADurb.Bin100]|jgi:hypothetical protein|nr:MAG: hypothetical protein BWX79_00300 [Alphaproteobacteria bacterium ADurb.Bin100]
MRSRSPSPSFPAVHRVHPEPRHVLIATGHFGRQVLWEQDRLLSGFELRVLVVRRTPKPMAASPLVRTGRRGVSHCAQSA